MKTCICCGTKADAVASTCANCGEASWSVVTGESCSAMSIEIKAEPPASLNLASVRDPDTAIEVPRVRRGKKP